MSGLKSARSGGKAALVVMLGISLAATLYTGTHTGGTHAYSSTTYDATGYKRNTSNSTGSPFSGVRIRLTRLSNGSSASSTAQPYSFPGYPAVSGGENIKFDVEGSSNLNGWSLKGTTYCADACSNFNPQTTSFVAGTSRTLKLYPGHKYRIDFIWQYLNPSAPKLSGSVSGNTANLSWTASTQPGGAAISAYYVYKNGSQVLKTTSRGASFALGCGTSFSYTVKAEDANGHYSAASNTYAASTAACPTPTPVPATPTPPPATPKPTPTPTPVVAQATPTPSGGGKGSTSGGSAPPKGTPSSGSAPAKPAAPSDTTPPDPPRQFQAAADQGNVGLGLSWEAASDPSGIAGYTLERSSDQTNWTQLATHYSDTSYDDHSTAFDTHYYYRLTATDNAGNTSDYAYADESTGGFEANADAGKTITITSGDQLAVANLPSGALREQADCQIVNDSTPANTTQSEVVGPYRLVCKGQDGATLGSFDQPVSWSINLSHQEKKYTKLTVALLDAKGNASDAGAKFNAASDVMVFTAKAAGPFVVLGTIHHGLPWATIISIVFIVLLAIGLVFFLVYRQQNKQDYDDYIRRKYYDF